MKIKYYMEVASYWQGGSVWMGRGGGSPAMGITLGDVYKRNELLEIDR